MIVNHADYMILSANANTPFWEHWEAEPYPQWAALTGIAHVPVTHTYAIEPHYHDCDEFWLLIEGDGEAWMDNRVYQYTANTAVYNPMGVIHRHQVSRQGSPRACLRGSSVRSGLGISIPGRWGHLSRRSQASWSPVRAIRVRSLIADRAAPSVSYASCRCAQVKALQMEWRRAMSIGTSLRGRCTYRSTDWRWT
jgi:mannose-6-phosphate isomerase-like protein (cupin superfamily)